MIRFDQKVCANLAKASRREWLETNGLGGFASSTITGLNTRRYHGLLTAATKPPGGRLCLLSKLEEKLIVDEQTIELSTNQYSGAIHPRGFQYLQEFRLDPFPVFVFEAGGIQLIKSVFMIAGENSTVLQYELRPPVEPGDRFTNCRLEVRPLLAFRDYHATTHENGALDANYDTQANLVRVEPYAGLPALYLAHDAETVAAQGYWYRNFEYREERERGLDFTEDLFQPFVLQFDLLRDGRAHVIASTEARDIRRVAEYRESEIARRHSLTTLLPFRNRENEFVRQLAQAADQFIVARGKFKTVRRLSLVQRLGARHHDRPAGLDACPWFNRDRQEHSAGILQTHQSGNAAEPFP